MPCFGTRTISSDMSSFTDAALLAEALEKVGLWAHSGADRLALANAIISKGAIILPDALEHKAVELKRSYAQLAIEQAAKKMRWRTRKTKTGYVLTR